eukprot:4859373-Prymnesium_polylepis.1
MARCPSDATAFAKCAKGCSEQCTPAGGRAAHPFNACSLDDDRCSAGYVCARTGGRTLCMPTEETMRRAAHSAVFTNMLRHAVGVVDTVEAA